MNRVYKKIVTLSIVIILVVAGLVLTSCNNDSQTEPPRSNNEEAIVTCGDNSDEKQSEKNTESACETEENTKDTEKVSNDSLEQTTKEITKETEEISEKKTEKITEISTEESKEESTEKVTTAVIPDRNIDWKLVWSDEFEGESLDLTKWSYQLGNGYNGWGNYESQYYTKENVAVKDGKLVITAKQEEIDGFLYTSGRIRTMTDDGQVLFSKLYGKIEARIAMPVGEGMWPAFWMMPVDNEYGNWPLSGEIDIVEARGRLPEIVNGTIHYGETAPNNKYSGSDYVFESSDISEFHVYAVEWDTNEIRWLVDGKVYYRVTNWYTVGEDEGVEEYPAPFDKPFYIILNLAIGGNYDSGKLPSKTDIPGEMKVDYVRVYDNPNGYSEVIKEEENQGKDFESFNKLKKTDNYIKDVKFDTVNFEALTTTPHYESDRWYFVAKDYFGADTYGRLSEKKQGLFFRCRIYDGGDKNYSIQLQHMVPLVKGYTYAVDFDAMADSVRNIDVQFIGNAGDDTVVYCNTATIQINESVTHYYCSFTMEDNTDLSALLEFNLGGTDGKVYIGNVSVKVLQ